MRCRIVFQTLTLASEYLAVIAQLRKYLNKQQLKYCNLTENSEKKLNFWLSAQFDFYCARVCADNQKKSKKIVKTKWVISFRNLRRTSTRRISTQSSKILASCWKSWLTTSSRIIMSVQWSMKWGKKDAIWKKSKRKLTAFSDLTKRQFLSMSEPLKMIGMEFVLSRSRNTWLMTSLEIDLKRLTWLLIKSPSLRRTGRNFGIQRWPKENLQHFNNSIPASIVLQLIWLIPK